LKRRTLSGLPAGSGEPCERFELVGEACRIGEIEEALRPAGMLPEGMLIEGEEPRNGFWLAAIDRTRR